MIIENVYSIESIEVQEVENGDWKKGFLINSGERIYYLNGEEPEDVVWDYRTVSGVSVSNLKHLGYIDTEYNIESKELKLVIKF